jgi:hypothetical protein
VREHDETDGAVRHRQPAFERPAARRDRHVAVASMVPVRARVTARRNALLGRLEQPDDDLVGDRFEVAVPGADRQEGIRCLEADHVVREAARPREGIEGSDRYGEDDPARPPCASHLDRRARGGTRRDAVVHEDHGPAPDRERVGPSTERSRATLDLRTCPSLDRRELVGRDAGAAQDVVVQDTHALFADGSHRELGLERHTQLANDHDVERRPEPSGHQRDGHTASWHSEHNGVGNGVPGECLGESTTGV